MQPLCNSTINGLVAVEEQNLEKRERERKDAAVAKERSVLVFCSVPRPAPAMTHRPLLRRTSTDYKDLNTGLLPNI